MLKGVVTYDTPRRIVFQDLLQAVRAAAGGAEIQLSAVRPDRDTLGVLEVQYWYESPPDVDPPIRPDQDAIRQVILDYTLADNEDDDHEIAHKANITQRNLLQSLASDVAEIKAEIAILKDRARNR